VRIIAAAVGTAALALCAPGVAGASVYCVGTSGSDCGFSYVGTGDGLKNALAAADTNVDFNGAPDTVRIGPGTYERTDGADFKTQGGDITIEGAGQSTILTTDAANNRTVLNNTSATGGTVRNLRVDLAGAANGIYDFQNVNDVRVTGPGPAIVGVHMTPGSRISRALIDPAVTQSVDVIGYGNVAVEDVAVRLRKGTSAVQGVAIVNDSPTGMTNATVRHLTVLGDGQTFTSGVDVQAGGNSTSAQTVNVSVRDSVLRNLAAPLDRFALTNTPAHPGTANITYRYSSLDASKNTATGPGSITAGPGNLPDPDPLFAPDMSLTAGSPLIDAGDPAGPEAGDSPLDVAGNPRIFNGRRDIGAFESQTPPPLGTQTPSSVVPVPVSAAASALTVAPTAFRAAASGPAVTAARHAPVGAIVRYVLNVDAAVRFTVRQKLPGRRVRTGKKTRCVKPSAKNRKRHGCTRLVTRGTFSEAGLAGGNSFRFRGRVGRKLRPGRYVLVAVPAAGGTAIRTAFRIVR
jgi:hypothetical protein